MKKKKHFENCGRTEGRTDATPWHKLIGSFGPDELKIIRTVFAAVCKGICDQGFRLGLGLGLGLGIRIMLALLTLEQLSQEQMLYIQITHWDRHPR